MNQRITAEEYKALRTTQPGKYKSRKSACGQGHKHDSIKEAQRCNELQIFLKLGEISELRYQPRFDLEIDGQKICAYIGDFAYHKDGKLIVEDVKSSYTAKLQIYRIKKKLMLAIRGIEIREVQ